MLLLFENRTGGLMSCFNLIAASMSQLKEENISKDQFYFKWYSKTYQNNINENLFDKFIFTQKTPPEGFPFTMVVSVFEKFHNFYSPIIPQETILKVNDALKHFNYFENPFFNYISNIVPTRPKSIGVHVRRTDHAIHGDILPDEYYFEKIDANLNTGKYENIFLATDEYKIVESFKNKYGSILFTNEDITRSNTDVTIPFCNYENKDKLAVDIFKEGIALSKCDKLIFTSSNVSTYVRLINPHMENEQIDTHIKFR